MLGMFGQSVRNFCPTFVRGELKSVRKINIRNFIHTMYSVYIFIYLIIFFLFIYLPKFQICNCDTPCLHLQTNCFLSFRRKPREKKARRETYCLHINLVLAICLSQICFLIGTFIISVNVVRIIPSGGFHPKQFQCICVKLVDAKVECPFIT